MGVSNTPMGVSLCIKRPSKVPELHTPMGVSNTPMGVSGMAWACPTWPRRASYRCFLSPCYLKALKLGFWREIIFGRGSLVAERNLRRKEELKGDQEEKANFEGGISDSLLFSLIFELLSFFQSFHLFLCPY